MAQGVARPSEGERAPPPPASATAGDIALWRTAYVNESGVLPIRASDRGMEYGVNGSFSITGAGTVKGWMRWEEFQPMTVGGAQTRSFTQLVEVDCQGGRGRLLALDLYPYNNLQGEVRHVDEQEPQWAYARPGSVLEQNIGMMCATARSALATVVAQAGASSSPAPSGSLASLAVPK